MTAAVIETRAVLVAMAVSRRVFVCYWVVLVAMELSLCVCLCVTG